MFDIERVAWAVAIFLATFLISLIVVGMFLVWLPARYFVDRDQRHFWIDRHPVIRITGVLLKNLAGLLMIVLGLGLSLPGVPGQGLLTILVGVILLDFPGKQRFERWLLRLPRVLRTVNRLRARYGREPLVIETATDGKSPDEAS